MKYEQRDSISTIIKSLNQRRVTTKEGDRKI